MSDKELKDELKFYKRWVHKLDDALWELTCEISREDRVSGVGSTLRASQISAEKLMTSFTEELTERQQTESEVENEKPNVD